MDFNLINAGVECSVKNSESHAWDVQWILSEEVTFELYLD